MPAWLLSLLEAFVPNLVQWAISLLESKFPGIAAILNQIIGTANASTNPKATMDAMGAHMGAFKETGTVGVAPELKV